MSRSATMWAVSESTDKLVERLSKKGVPVKKTVPKETTATFVGPKGLKAAKKLTDNG